MSRSSSKGYYVDQKLLNKVRKSSFTGNDGDDVKVDGNQPSAKKKVGKKFQTSTPGAIRTWSRRSSVHPDMIDKIISIHNGREHKEVRITSEMVGMKLGALAPTRKRGIHGKAGKR